MRISYLRRTDGRTDRQNISAGVELRFAAKNMLDLSVLHSYLYQINNKTLTPKPK